jgi:hypothetical protein
MLPLPDDPTLPFFAYGLLEPGAPGYTCIQNYINVAPVRASLKSSLRICDGLPLLDTLGESAIDGFVLHFQPGSYDQAYRGLCGFGASGPYRWEVVLLHHPALRANVLVGRQPQNHMQFDEGINLWGWRDPVLIHGLGVVQGLVREHTKNKFESVPVENMEWDRFFCVQSTYLLLWVVIERYTSLAFGPGLDPTEKVTRFGDSAEFKVAISHVVRESRMLFDSRDPRIVYCLEPDDPKKTVRYYYAVRSYVSHRGMGDPSSVEVVRKSLIELEEIVRITLSYERASYQLSPLNPPE